MVGQDLEVVHDRELTLGLVQEVATDTGEVVPEHAADHVLGPALGPDQESADIREARRKAVGPAVADERAAKMIRKYRTPLRIGRISVTIL